MGMSGGMVPLPALTVMAPSPNSCSSTAKPFACHTSGKFDHNSFSCHTSKIALSQVFCLPHIRAPRGMATFVMVNQPSHTGSISAAACNLELFCTAFSLYTFFRPSEIAERFLGAEGRRPQKPPLLYWNLQVTSRPVTKLRISIVQYLNTAPLVWGFTNGPLHGKYDLSFTVPSQCSEDLRT